MIHHTPVQTLVVMHRVMHRSVRSPAAWSKGAFMVLGITRRLVSDDARSRSSVFPTAPVHVHCVQNQTSSQQGFFLSEKKQKTASFLWAMVGGQGHFS